MSTRKELPGRMLRLLSLLQSRREWSGRELAERLGVTDRTLRRDIDRLRSLDYPVTGTTGTAGGYRLVSGANLPPLLLDDDEAVAVAVGLVGAAASGVTGIDESSMSALAKLEQVLPARLRPKLAAVSTAEVVQRPGMPLVDAAVLAVVAGCCRDHEILGFDYETRSGERSRRRVEPYQLVTIGGRWYLLAYDPDRADWRSFRVDRMTSLTPALHRFQARPIPSGGAAAYLAEALRTASYRYTARMVVALPADEVLAAFQGTVAGSVEPAGPRSCEVRLSAEFPTMLARYVAGIVALGADYELTADQETAELLGSLGRRIAESAAGALGHDQTDAEGQDAEGQRGGA